MKIAHSLFKESEPLNKEIIKESEVKLESISSEIFLMKKKKIKIYIKKKKKRSKNQYNQKYQK